MCVGSLPFINVGIDFTEKSVYEKNTKFLKLKTLVMLSDVGNGS